jgi:hypothetical protein
MPEQMQVPNVICKHCQRDDIGLQRSGISIRLEKHKEVVGEIYYCVGSDELARDNVVYDDVPYILELEEQIGARKPEHIPIGDGTTSEDAIQHRFRLFHQENPEVYQALVNRALELKAQGYNHYSMAALWEWLRLHLRPNVKTKDQYKLSNDYRSRYARLIMETVPELDGMFEIRGLTAK